MKPRFADLEFQPLVTDDDIERRVSDLIGRANVRQLWLLFLDADHLQLPVVIPIEGLPSAPTDEQTERVIESVAEIMEGIGAASVVFVWERYGPPTLSGQDSAWARSVRESGERAKLPLRAMLLSHRAGVSWIADEDCGFVSLAAPE